MPGVVFFTLIKGVITANLHCGDIDFIFGSATAYFEHCTLESLLRTKTSAQSDLVSTTSTLHDSGSDTSALCHSNSDMVQKNYSVPACSFTLVKRT